MAGGLPANEKVAVPARQTRARMERWFIRDGCILLRAHGKACSRGFQQRHPEFSSVIDLLRGAVGNNTALGKQLTNIRKQATRQASRSASNVIDVNASVKKAA